MTEEGTIKAKIRLALGRLPNVKLFNNPCGEAWIGNVVAKDTHTVTLVRPRHITFGLFPGSTDLIGWTEVLITPEMVGRRIAVFTSPEVKVPGEKPKTHQAKWIENVLAAGGIAGPVTSPEEALSLVGVK
jgi:hypothetical protein